MNVKTVGKTGITVSELAFGTMSFGSTADKAESEKMFHAAVEKGINFFDSANVYGNCQAELFLGEFIKKERQKYVVTSKVYWPTSEDPNGKGLSKKNIFKSLDDTLLRLGTDYLDFYFVHDFDHNTPMETTLEALDQLVKAGKILHPAVSNWSAWQIEKALGIQAKNGYSPFELMEPMYNLVKRQDEVELLPMAQAEKMGVISYSPLGGGLLTGKYGETKRPVSGRLVEDQRYAQRYGEKTNFKIAAEFTQFAKKLGVHPAPLAIAWVNYHQGITAPIIGARNMEQLAVSLEAVNFEMTEEFYQELSKLSPSPQPATDRGEILTGNWK
ncbi:aldo/keto reductase [Carnobacterium divergens]|uniref:aldo/keto reductase n=1 Tax=Carnobacterium divergens TaxID=2748 RepID=UPI001071ED66|nr:aldo/keto reductase [Carnobacterium divergens]TFJ41177.1 aldo/keto reductase [Carnobacterium divergens]TFJ49816.1 aldo/keto reductase [Carnobacterium divergens]TFJ55101.1 aldo/keto reductase [Carnobacterium divergens]TFJ61667.1 aldo/keto reductase [Carnobacterium divergens]TFJ71389.1 aldo/keto reductase [Carnobacterium divergens]